MTRSERRAQRDRAIARHRSIAAIRTPGDERPAVDEGRALIGHGRPRARRFRRDENRSNYGFRPVVHRYAAIADQI